MARKIIGTTQAKIVSILVNTRDWEIVKRQIIMRLRHRADFEMTYEGMLLIGQIEERGAGTPRSPKITRLVRSDIL